MPSDTFVKDLLTARGEHEDPIGAATGLWRCHLVVGVGPLDTRRERNARRLDRPSHLK